MAAVTTAPLATGLYAWLVEPHWVETTRRPLPLAGLPASLEGRLLVQLTDLHVGPKVEDAFVLDVFRTVRELGPDIVVYTGDFVTYNGPGRYAQLQRVLSHVPRGTLATVGVLGNHDYGFGWSDLDVARRIADILDDAGVSVLRNDMVDIDGLQIAGVEDLWSGRFDLDSVRTRLDPTSPSIVLCHNPDGADEPGWDGFHGWILSGHTHGGQCKPPFLPPPLLPVKNRRYTAGEFGLSSGRRLYINRGVGHHLRVRFNVRPEITVFRLTRA